MNSPLDYLRDATTHLIKGFCSIMRPWNTAAYSEVAIPTQEYKYELPINYDTLSKEFAQQYVQELVIQPPKIFRLTNVYATWQGVVFKNLRIFMPSLQSPGMAAGFQEPILLKQWVGSPRQLNGYTQVAIIHSQFGPENYFHWMVDSLQRLILLKQYYPEIPIMVLEPMTEFVAKTIEVLEIKNVVKVSKAEVLEIKELIMPQHVAPLGHSNPLLMRLVRNEIMKLGKREVLPHRKIFVSRDKQKSRRINNQKEINYVLNKYGYETVYFEGMSIQQQIQTIQEAAVLVSVHGANLVNIIFMNPGTTVIELTSEALHSPIYWRLSSIFTLNYYVLPCVSAVKEDISYHSDADIHVDEFKLEELLSLATNQGIV